MKFFWYTSAPSFLGETSRDTHFFFQIFSTFSQTYFPGTLRVPLASKVGQGRVKGVSSWQTMAQEPNPAHGLLFASFVFLNDKTTILYAILSKIRVWLIVNIKTGKKKNDRRGKSKKTSISTWKYLISNNTYDKSNVHI